MCAPNGITGPWNGALSLLSYCDFSSAQLILKFSKISEAFPGF